MALFQTRGPQYAIGAAWSPYQHLLTKRPQKTLSEKHTKRKQAAQRRGPCMHQVPGRSPCPGRGWGGVGAKGHEPLSTGQLRGEPRKRKEQLQWVGAHSGEALVCAES